jgi:hypothetical protein
LPLKRLYVWNRSWRISRGITAFIVIFFLLLGSLAYRTINVTGGFSPPGHNFSLGDKRGDTFLVEIGSPAATRSIQRYIIKYVLLIGSGAGE